MLNTENWKKVLKADPTDWLLEDDNPAVRYLALRDIVDAGEKEVKEARRKAHREGPIATILDNMNPGGWWIHPGAVYTPKCKGTSWSILALAQMGGSIEDKRIASACSYLLDNALARGGQFSSTGDATKTFNCFQGNMLTSLMDLGCEDKRIYIALEWTARTVTGESLPSQVTNEGLSIGKGSSSNEFYPFAKITGPLFSCGRMKHCAWAGEKIMLAFSRIPEKQRSPLVQRAIKTGVDYFFTNDPATANFPGEMAPQPDRRWWKFTFPVTGMDLLQVVEALTGLGYGSDPRLANTLDLIRSKQDENGRWLREKNYGYWHKWWVDYGPYNKPNKWVTLRAMRVLKQAGQQM